MYRDLQQNDHILDQKRHLSPPKKVNTQISKWEKIFAIYKLKR